MRIRRLVTLTAGAALGAGVMYLLDPEHGPARREDARRRAVAQARSGAARTLNDVRARAADVAVAAVSGYWSGRADVDVREAADAP